MGTTSGSLILLQDVPVLGARRAAFFDLFVAGMAKALCRGDEKWASLLRLFPGRHWALDGSYPRAGAVALQAEQAGGLGSRYGLERAGAREAEGGGEADEEGVQALPVRRQQLEDLGHGGVSARKDVVGRCEGGASAQSNGVLGDVEARAAHTLAAD
jgi:hypothetical protein